LGIKIIQKGKEKRGKCERKGGKQKLKGKLMVNW
jgi:hypothetical protein